MQKKFIEVNENLLPITAANIKTVSSRFDYHKNTLIDLIDSFFNIKTKKDLGMKKSIQNNLRIILTGSALDNYWKNLGEIEEKDEKKYAIAFVKLVFKNVIFPKYDNNNGYSDRYIQALNKTLFLMGKYSKNLKIIKNNFNHMLHAIFGIFLNTYDDTKTAEKISRLDVDQKFMGVKSSKLDISSILPTMELPCVFTAEDNGYTLDSIISKLIKKDLPLLDNLLGIIQKGNDQEHFEPTHLINAHRHREIAKCKEILTKKNWKDEDIKKFITIIKETILEHKTDTLNNLIKLLTLYKVPEDKAKIFVERVTNEIKTRKPGSLDDLSKNINNFWPLEYTPGKKLKDRDFISLAESLDQLKTPDDMNAILEPLKHFIHKKSILFLNNDRSTFSPVALYYSLLIIGNNLKELKVNGNNIKEIFNEIYSIIDFKYSNVKSLTQVKESLNELYKKYNNS